jgi:glycerol-3-phosphate acyltransferase PlsY
MLTYTAWILITAAYLLGSISSAILIARLLGLPDPRGQGSGNPGATNMLRIGGKKAAGFTLAGDMLKGLIPVLIGHALDLPINALALIGFAAFIGHLYPIFFQFKGGKGVATYLGMALGLHWSLGLATAATWLFVAKVLRISSLSALIATALAPLYAFYLIPYVSGETHTELLVSLLLLQTLILFWRHRSNIQNLLSGAEGKIGR